jgi:hypothetical protein
LESDALDISSAQIGSILSPAIFCSRIQDPSAIDDSSRQKILLLQGLGSIFVSIYRFLSGIGLHPLSTVQVPSELKPTFLKYMKILTLISEIVLHPENFTLLPVCLSGHFKCQDLELNLKSSSPFFSTLADGFLERITFCSGRNQHDRKTVTLFLTIV